MILNGNKMEKQETGIFNGEMGKITRISTIGEEIEADFDRKKGKIFISGYGSN